jgi:hypothetical protein
MCDDGCVEPFLGDAVAVAVAVAVAAVTGAYSSLRDSHLTCCSCAADRRAACEGRSPPM